MPQEEAAMICPRCWQPMALSRRAIQAASAVNSAGRIAAPPPRRANVKQEWRHASIVLRSNKKSCCHTVPASMLCFVQGIVCRQKQAFGHPHCSTVSREGGSRANTCSNPASSLRISFRSGSVRLIEGPWNCTLNPRIPAVVWSAAWITASLHRKRLAHEAQEG
jgi:hypothetical protein